MARMSSILGVLAVGSSLLDVVNANAFLGAAPTVESERMSEAAVQESLLSEVMGAMGAGAIDGRLTQMEDALRPMYVALPKNEHGNVGHATVRYALHRLFVQRHGWYVKGLEPAGESWNSSSPAGILKDRVPEYIQGLFEHRMGENGLNLHEVAILASTLEHLIHSEAQGRLEVAFKVYEIPITGSVSEEQATKVIETYMMAYIVGMNLTALTPKQIRLRLDNMQRVYPYWSETQQWFQHIYQDVVSTDLGRSDPSLSRELTFETLVRMTDKIGDGYGRFQDKECQQLKSDLLKYEDGSNGRVLLSTFYNAALNGHWQFSERIEYLRELGALDESGLGEPSVIAANYIGASSNCIATSSFYSVCCIDECEGLLGHLEVKVAAAHTDPARIAALVADLPSTTVTAPRSLSAALLQRLDEISAANGGVVPLHGRLFAQWMHHVFPRECPYPHTSGTTTPRTTAEWSKDTSIQPTVSEQEMPQYLAAVLSRRPLEAPRVEEEDEVEVALPWTDDEELLVIRPSSPMQASAGGVWTSVRNVFLVAASGALALTAVRSFNAGTRAFGGPESQKYYV